MILIFRRVVERTLALSLLGGPLLSAQDEAGEPPLTSGPMAGTELTPVPCYATDGPFRGKEFDAAAEIGESPGALLFIHELTRNTAPVLRGLDDLASEFSILGFKSFTIMLGADRTAAEAQLGRVNGSLRLSNPIVLSVDGAEGPGNYALNRKSALTLVFVKDGVVAKSMALTDTGPNDVPVIRKEIEALTGEIPADPKAFRELVAKNLPADPEALKDLAADQALELRRLRRQLAQVQQRMRGQMQRQLPQRRMQEDPPARNARPGPQPDSSKPAVRRQGKPPEDPKLNSLLRSFIRQTNDDARADEVFAEIKARAAESDELESEAVEMFKLMLSFRDRYGTAHAQELAQSFLDERDSPQAEE